MTSIANTRSRAHRVERRRPFTRALGLAALLALTACGGGGGDDSSTDSGSLSSEAATDYAADATVVTAETATALEVGVSTAQAVTAAQAEGAGAAASSSRSMAASSSTGGSSGSATAQAVANVPVSCPGGGTAQITITGGTALSVLNGVFDSGETYALTFTDCRGSAGAAAVNGSLALTVTGVSGAEVAVQATAANFAVASSRGRVTLDGGASWRGSQSVLTDGAGTTTTLTSALNAERIAVTTAWGARSSSFALSAVATQRSSTWLNGALQSASMSGTWTVSATLVNGSFSATVATSGSTTCAADGTPSAGTWRIALPTAALELSVGAGSATLKVDEGKNGSVDRSYTVQLPALSSAAG